MGGVGQIPWSSMDRWAQREGIEDEDFDEFCLLLDRMDTVWLEDQAQRLKAERKEG